jgi:hypothetical protein
LENANVEWRLASVKSGNKDPKLAVTYCEEFLRNNLHRYLIATAGELETVKLLNQYTYLGVLDSEKTFSASKRSKKHRSRDNIASAEREESQSAAQRKVRNPSIFEPKHLMQETASRIARLTMEIREQEFPSCLNLKEYPIVIFK